jgi:hypothetical protein
MEYTYRPKLWEALLFTGFFLGGFLMMLTLPGPQHVVISDLSDDMDFTYVPDQEDGITTMFHWAIKTGTALMSVYGIALICASLTRSRRILLSAEAVSIPESVFMPGKTVIAIGEIVRVRVHSYARQTFMIMPRTSYSIATIVSRSETTDVSQRFFKDPPAFEDFLMRLAGNCRAAHEHRDDDSRMIGMD